MILCFTASLIYLIVGNVIFKGLKNKSDLSPDEKFLLAWMYYDKGLGSIRANLEKFKLLLLEASEEGSSEAYVSLGNLYENSKFGGKGKKAMPKAECLENAMRCYKNAFPMQEAIKKYNKAKARLEKLK
jgi:TPR repeat protein